MPIRLTPSERQALTDAADVVGAETVAGWVRTVALRRARAAAGPRRGRVQVASDAVDETRSVTIEVRLSRDEKADIATAADRASAPTASGWTLRVALTEAAVLSRECRER